MGKLANPVVVITGASSGIGRAAALAFAGKGRGVLINNASMVATLAEPYVAPTWSPSTASAAWA